MAKRSAIITLQAFIKKYLFKRGIDEDDFHRYHVICADGFREMSIHDLPIAITTLVTVDTDAQTVSWPTDMIDYIFIAIEKDRRWWIFTRDDTMVDKSITGITGGDLTTLIYVSGFGAVGGLNEKWFTPDYENRRFLTSGVNSSDVVVLKYQSTGVEVVNYSSSENIDIPVYAEKALECYLDYTISEQDGGALSDRQWRKRQYDDALLMMRSVNDSTMKEITDAWLASSNQTFLRGNM